MQEIQFFPFIFCYLDGQGSFYQNCYPQSGYWNPTTQDKQQQEMPVDEQESRWNFYFEIFQKELRRNKEKYQKKIWQSFQDDLLIQLRERNLSWVQISKSISKTNPQICKRRYIRLTVNEKKWPKPLDDLIKRLHEQQGKKWDQIHNIILEQSVQQFPKYSLKKIKQRYLLHLRKGIEQKDWEIQEDLLLLSLVKEKGRKWKQFTGQFEGRTQLQLKNRYNGTLKLIQKRVLRKVNFHIKSKGGKKNPMKNITT